MWICNIAIFDTIAIDDNLVREQIIDNLDQQNI